MTAWSKRTAIVKARRVPSRQSKQVLDAFVVKKLTDEKRMLQSDVRYLTRELEDLRVQAKRKMRTRVKERLFDALTKFDDDGMNRLLEPWERDELRSIMRDIRAAREGAARDCR